MVSKQSVDLEYHDEINLIDWLRLSILVVHSEPLPVTSTVTTTQGARSPIYKAI